MLAVRNPSCLNLPCEKSLSYQSVDQRLSQKLLKYFVSVFSSSLDIILWCVCARARLLYSSFFFFGLIANKKTSKHSYFPYGLLSIHQIFLFETLEDATSLHDINASLLSNGMSK